MKLKLLLAVSLLCFSFSASATLPREVSYRANANLEACFLRQFAQWNLALGDNYFTLLLGDDSAEPTITLVQVDELPDFYVGMTRFNADGTFTISILSAVVNEYGTELDSVMLHEIGHVMGLGHSPFSDDVMNARPTVTTLSPRDVERVRALYGLGVFELSFTIKATGKRHVRTFTTAYPVTWDFGDGSKITTPQFAAVHNFAARGWYLVTASCLGQEEHLIVRIK